MSQATKTLLLGSAILSLTLCAGIGIGALFVHKFVPVEQQRFAEQPEQSVEEFLAESTHRVDEIMAYGRSIDSELVNALEQRTAELRAQRHANNDR